jgi:hypothetical protein
MWRAAGLLKPPPRRQVLRMSRTLIASLAGIAGFIAYVVAVLLLADHVIALHWTLEFLFFAAAGILWVWPAKWLMVWAVKGGGAR